MVSDSICEMPKNGLNEIIQKLITSTEAKLLYLYINVLLFIILFYKIKTYL